MGIWYDGMFHGIYPALYNKPPFDIRVCLRMVDIPRCTQIMAFNEETESK